MLPRQSSRATIVALVGVALMVPYFLIGESAAAEIYWIACIGPLLAVGFVSAWRLGRDRVPWLLILAGQFLFLGGDVAWLWLQRVIESDAYPSIGDAFYLSGYVPIAIGLGLLLRAQKSRRELGGFVDGLIVTVGASVLLWVFFIGPAVLDGSMSFLGRLVTASYPSADVLLIAIGAQLAFRLRRSVPALLLGMALGLLLIGDMTYAYLATWGTYVGGHPIDATWWLSYVSVVALVAHPRVGELSAAQVPAPPQLTVRRVALLAVVTLAAPATIALRSVAGASLELRALLGGTMVLFSLVVVRLVLVARQLEASQAQLVHDATHDALTGLGNRVLYTERVTDALHTSPGGPAVLCLDLDDFKGVNDSLGHAAGDRLLQIVAERLMRVVGEQGDVARLGGDEFAIVTDGKPTDVAIDIAERVLIDIHRPVVLDDDVVVHPRASVGIAYGTHGETVDALLRDADIAMYMAKHEGKGRWSIYQPDMRRHVLDRFELRAGLAAALDAGELVLHYQPIVGVETGEISAFEALLRWEHPTRGRLEAAQFISIAEATGLIEPIGRWVIHEACRQAIAIDPGPDGPRMAVNVSPSQLRSETLLDDVRDALVMSGLDSGRLVIEVDESVLIEDDDRAIARLVELRRTGVRIAIDDFGAGFATLRELQSFPVDAIKLDHSFIRSSLGHDASVLDSLVGLANSLGLETIGEGVEDADQLALLAAVQCDLAQGYLFSPAVPQDRLTAAAMPQLGLRPQDRTS